MEKFLSRLKCPISGNKLQPISQAELEKLLGESIQLEKSFKGHSLSLLIDTSKNYYYPVYDDIYCLLPDYAKTVNKNNTLDENDAATKIKKSNREFYDSVGWEMKEDDFKDAELFEDLRPISQDYIQKCRSRLNNYLLDSGEFIVDVASGPVQYDEYVEYSQNYEKRICVDFSISALKQAQKKLGDKSYYVLGDVTNMPFQDNSIDTVLSIHTIYHVPKDEQLTALNEIYRIQKPGNNALIIYSWGMHSLLIILFFFPFWIWRMVKAVVYDTYTFIRTLFSRREGEYFRKNVSRGLYYHAHSYRYFKKYLSFKYRVVVWRTVAKPFQHVYIHKFLLGRQILSLLYKLEDKFPKTFGRIGSYPLIIIEK